MKLTLWRTWMAGPLHRAGLCDAWMGDFVGAKGPAGLTKKALMQHCCGYACLAARLLSEDMGAYAKNRTQEVPTKKAVMQHLLQVPQFARGPGYRKEKQGKVRPGARVEGPFLVPPYRTQSLEFRGWMATQSSEGCLGKTWACSVSQRAAFR